MTDWWKAMSTAAFSMEKVLDWFRFMGLVSGGCR